MHEKKQTPVFVFISSRLSLIPLRFSIFMDVGLLSCCPIHQLFQGLGDIFILRQNYGLIGVSFNLMKKTQLEWVRKNLSAFFSCLSQIGKGSSGFKVITLCLTRICTQLALPSREYVESPHSTS